MTRKTPKRKKSSSKAKAKASGVSRKMNEKAKVSGKMDSASKFEVVSQSESSSKFKFPRYITFPDCTKHAIPYKLHEVSHYQTFVEPLKACVRQSTVYAFDDDELTPTADFKDDLKLEPYSHVHLKNLLKAEYQIERGYGSSIRCIDDVIKNILYLRLADKEMAALPPFKSDNNPWWRGLPKYKEGLNVVTKFARLYAKDKAKVSRPTCDFKKDLGMTEEDIYIFGYHLSDEIEECPFNILEEIYYLRLRCCQDLADVLFAPRLYLSLGDETDEDDDDPLGLTELGFCCPIRQQGNGADLRQGHGTGIITESNVAARLARPSPRLRKEVVEYMSHV